MPFFFHRQGSSEEIIASAIASGRYHDWQSRRQGWNYESPKSCQHLLYQGAQCCGELVCNYSEGPGKCLFACSYPRALYTPQDNATLPSIKPCQVIHSLSSQPVRTSVNNLSTSPMPIDQANRSSIDIHTERYLMVSNSNTTQPITSPPTNQCHSPCYGTSTGVFFNGVQNRAKTGRRDDSRDFHSTSKMSPFNSSSPCIFTSMQATDQVVHYLHLRSNHTLSLSTVPPQGHPEWASTTFTYEGTEIERQRMKVHISTSIPNRGKPRYLVQYHSSFPIPVLTSILQTSIRRRKPLPSVRVAMELADRSMDDLIRRLPIIILEDSTFHPDFGLLVWLMMAQSEGYAIPDPLVDRVLQIVYEIASCPWQDRGPDPHNSHHTDRDAEERLQSTLTLSALIAAVEEPLDMSTAALLGSLFETDAILAWSMLVRAEYSRMSNDMLTLREHATRWVRRWRNRIIVGNMEARTLQGVTTWLEVPCRLYLDSKEKAAASVRQIVDVGLPKLSRSDICKEGIDFFCTSVLDDIVQDQDFVASSRNILAAASATDLMHVLQDCMRKYSVGVNHRRPLLTSPLSPVREQSAIDNMPIQRLWNDHARPRIESWQENYIQQHLAL